MSTNKQRRRITRLVAWTSAIGGSRLIVPNSWVRPVIESAVLPAHAQTSAEAPQASGPFIYSTPGQFQLELPANATEITIDAYGAAGGDQRSGSQIFGGQGGCLDRVGTLTFKGSEYLKFRAACSGFRGVEVPDLDTEATVFRFRSCDPSRF